MTLLFNSHTDEIVFIVHAQFSVRFGRFIQEIVFGRKPPKKLIEETSALS